MNKTKNNPHRPRTLLRGRKGAKVRPATRLETVRWLELAVIGQTARICERATVKPELPVILF